MIVSAFLPLRHPTPEGNALASPFVVTLSTRCCRYKRRELPNALGCGERVDDSPFVHYSVDIPSTLGEADDAHRRSGI